MSTIAENISFIKNRIETAANGRKITLLAVTKTFSADCAKQAIDTGILDIAESKIQEAIPKFEALSNSLNGINKHFIGHLQSNKAKKAVLNFDLIQSLDSIDLAKDIIRESARITSVDAKVVYSLNYYIDSKMMEERGFVVEGSLVYIDGILRLNSLTDEEWSNLFKQYFKDVKLIYYAWPNENKEARRLFILSK